MIKLNSCFDQRFDLWRISSVGRASALQAEGHRFEPCILHCRLKRRLIIIIKYADVAELADALDLGSSIFVMWGFESLHPHYFFADLAQLAEHLSCKQGVGGSNPLVGIIRHFTSQSG